MKGLAAHGAASVQIPFLSIEEDEITKKDETLETRTKNERL